MDSAAPPDSTVALPQSPIEATTDAVYTSIKTMAIDHNVTASNLIIIVTSAMEIVEKYPSLSGPEKQAVVIHVVKRLVGESDISTDQKKLVYGLVEIALPNIINIVVKATHGLLNINKDDPKGGCFSACFKK